MTHYEAPHPKRNRLLAGLSAKDSRALIASGEVIHLKLKRRLYGEDRPVASVYFPIDCMVSILVGAEGSLLEMAMIGNEGFVGAPAILDDGRAIGTTIVQLEGKAMRVDIEAIQARPGAQARCRTPDQAFAARVDFPNYAIRRLPPSPHS